MKFEISNFFILRNNLSEKNKGISVAKFSIILYPSTRYRDASVKLNSFTLWKNSNGIFSLFTPSIQDKETQKRYQYFELSQELLAFILAEAKIKFSKEIKFNGN